MASAKKKKDKKPTIVLNLIAPVVLPPRLYSPLESLAKDALLYASNHSGMRKAISNLVFAMRSIAEESVGHITADIIALEALLKRSDPRQQELPLREPEKDPIVELARQKHLNEDQEYAAQYIKKVWTAWGRHLQVAARSYDGGGGGGDKPLMDPLSGMGQELWESWRDVYTPWYDLAKTRAQWWYYPLSKDQTIKGKTERTRGGMVANTKLVLAIIMEPVFPGNLDMLLRLDRGTSLRVLKEELTELSKRIEQKGVT